MSQQIANVNLAGASVGTTGSVSWGKLLPPQTIEQQMRPGQASAATLLIHNESGAQLLLTFPDTGRTVSFPAGKWAAMIVRSNEVSLTYKVLALAPSPLFTSLLVDFYFPGEPVDPMGTLGNSPIGGPTTSVTQVIQDGQPNGQTIVESTPTGLAYSTISLTTNGRLTLEQDTTGSPYYIQMISGNNPAFFYKFYIDFTTGSFGLFDGKNNKNLIFAIGSGDFHTDANLNASGSISGLAGQSTVGSFGVPMIVAQAIAVNVANNALATILSYAPVTGMYRVSAFARIRSTLAGTVQVSASYNDAEDNTAAFANLVAGNVKSGAAAALMDGSVTVTGQIDLSLHSVTFRAHSGTNIVCQYQNTQATNDTVSFLIERLQ